MTLMESDSIRRVVATVLGIEHDEEYLLAETALQHQLVVLRQAFEGDWSDVRRGDMVELIVSGTRLSRVLRARRLPGPTS